jgi:hypothetical protein
LKTSRPSGEYPVWTEQMAQRSVPTLEEPQFSRDAIKRCPGNGATFENRKPQEPFVISSDKKRDS